MAKQWSFTDFNLALAMACPIKELSPSTTFNLIPSIVPGRTMMLMTMSDPCMDCLDNVGAGKVEYDLASFSCISKASIG